MTLQDCQDGTTQCVCFCVCVYVCELSTSAVIGFNTEVSQVCLQTPHTVTIIYLQPSPDTTLGSQQTEVFDLTAFQQDSIKSMHLNDENVNF